MTRQPAPLPRSSGRKAATLGLALTGTACTGAVLATLAWSAACADDFSVEAVQVDTLAGGRIVVTSPDVPNPMNGELPLLVEELRIGSMNGTCDAFGQAFSVTVDDAGRIYVADFQANEIRVFDAQGECIRTFGREGEGPGEFRMLAGIAWQPPGLLWAMDALSYRLTAFDSAGSVRATHSVGRSMAASLPWPLTVDADGALHWWDPAERKIVKFGMGHQLIPLDTAWVPQLQVELATQTEGSLTMLFTVPESPSILWAVDREGHLWLANTSVFELHETTYDGDTVRTVRLQRSPSRLEGRERDSIAAAYDVAASALPRYKRLFGGVRVDANGWIWVTREVTPKHVWDVFDEMGRYLGPIVSPVPIETRPVPVFGAGTVTAVAEDELGVQYVVRLRALY